MSNPNQSVRTCKLKVDLKCCTGCQKKASTKLQTISGVSAVEYNKEKGLMTVTGDVEPMTLVHKLTRWGKKAELVSVNYQLDDDDLLSDSEEDFNDEDEEEEWDTDPKPMERETKKKKKKGILRKSSLLGCFGSKPPKVVLPYPRQNRNQQRLFPHMQPHPHPMMQQQPPFRMMNHQPMMQQQPHPMMWPQQPQAQMMMMQPQGPMMGAAMPMAYNGNMFQPGPPQARPYFMKDLKVNPSLHYQKS